MGLHMDWEHHAGYSAVRLSGAPSLGQFFSCVELLSVESASREHRRLLMDLRGITTLHSLTEQSAIGDEAARRLGHLKKIASVVPEDGVARSSGRPASKQGLHLLVFTSEEEAVRWLCSEDDAAPA
jgi:hypothetical protein